MIFYRVLPQYDQRHKNPKVRDGNIYVAHELYTPSEVECQKLNVRYMQLIDVPCESVYWAFGVRFCDNA